MKVTTLSGVCLLGLVLVVSPVTAGEQQQPQQEQQQKPATPAAAKPAAPQPFPQGAVIGWVNIDRIADESKDGQAMAKRVDDLQQKLLAQLNEKNKALQENQEKLKSGGNLMSEDARAKLAKEIERQQIEIQRAQQDASAEVEELRQQVQMEFQRKIVPIIQQVSEEKGLHFLFAVEAGGIVWARPDLDLTSEIIQRYDAAVASGAVK